MGNKTSIIWKISSEDFSELVKNSQSYSEILRNIGLKTETGGNFKTLKLRIKSENVEVTHILNNVKKSKTIIEKSITESFIENSTMSTRNIKTKLLKNKMLPYKCSICNQNDYWIDGKLSLQLDHINGNNTDHRLENLRFVCPNCHSQTDNFSGRREKYNLKSVFCDCGLSKDIDEDRCIKCNNIEEI